MVKTIIAVKLTWEMYTNGTQIIFAIAGDIDIAETSTAKIKEQFRRLKKGSQLMNRTLNPCI